MMAKTISATTMRMMTMTISTSLTQQPSFHDWAKAVVEIIPSLRTKTRERRLVVVVLILHLFPLVVRVLQTQHPLEVGGREKQGVTPIQRRGGGGQKRGRALTQPFKTPRKSPNNNQDNDDEESGFTFQNMMGMMMMQNRHESEQREQQNRIDAEQRDWEYQLRREEMAIAREDARAQRQLMNVMLMAMLNRNGVGGSTQAPPGSPMNDSFPQQPNE